MNQRAMIPKLTRVSVRLLFDSLLFFVESSDDYNVLSQTFAAGLGAQMKDAFKKNFYGLFLSFQKILLQSNSMN